MTYFFNYHDENKNKWDHVSERGVLSFNLKNYVSTLLWEKYQSQKAQHIWWSDMSLVPVYNIQLFFFFFIKTTFHFNHILSCANHAHPVSEPLNLQNPLHYTCLTRLPAQSKCLKLPEAQIISLTSLKTHEMLRRRAVSLPLCLPQSSDSCHTSSSQMGISFHISFIFAQTHLQLWAYTAINTSLHSETWARMSV